MLSRHQVIPEQTRARVTLIATAIILRADNLVTPKSCPQRRAGKDLSKLWARLPHQCALGAARQGPTRDGAMEGLQDVVSRSYQEDLRREGQQGMPKTRKTT